MSVEFKVRRCGRPARMQLAKPELIGRRSFTHHIGPQTCGSVDVLGAMRLASLKVLVHGARKRGLIALIVGSVKLCLLQHSVIQKWFGSCRAAVKRQDPKGGVGKRRQSGTVLGEVTLLSGISKH